MSRAKKSTPIHPIQNIDEANGVLHIVGILVRSTETIERELAEKVATLRQEADAAIKPLQAQTANHVVNIKLFAVKHRQELLAADKKTVTLSSGIFGWRLTPPKVTAGRGGDEKILDILKSLELTKYIRNIESIDKEALLKEKPQIQGVRYTQTEKFFVEPKTAVEFVTVVSE